MSISENFIQISQSIPSHVTLVTVSKTQPISALEATYEAGCRIFGENKIQEMTAKYEALPKDISWHMIGHLQTNKIKHMAHFVAMVHGVDTLEKVKELHKQAQKHQRVITCLLQVKIAQEETKFGLSFEEATAILNNPLLQEWTNVKIVGFMGMASFTNQTDQVQAEFESLHQFYNSHQQKHQLTTLSMGMSGDYLLAIRSGSTMVRVGSAIFGERNYNL